MCIAVQSKKQKKQPKKKKKAQIQLKVKKPAVPNTILLTENSNGFRWLPNTRASAFEHYSKHSPNQCLWTVQ